MALQYNYFPSQEDFAREAMIRVYAYERYPSSEKRLEDRDRYPSVYKLFNNRPSFGDASAGAHMSQPPDNSGTGRVSHRSISPHPDVGIQTHVVAHPNAYPKAVESVNYYDTGRLSSSPRSPQPHVVLVGKKSQAPVPPQNHVVTLPKGSSQTVESVKYGYTSKANQSPRDKEIGRDGKKQEGDPGEDQCVDAAAAEFIEWKLRTLKMCKA